MADSRIKDLTTTATSPASDDFLVLDGAGNGTRKISANTATLLPALGGMTEDEIEAFTYNLTNSRRSAQAWVFDGTAGASVTLSNAIGTAVSFSLPVAVPSANPSSQVTVLCNYGSGLAPFDDGFIEIRTNGALRVNFRYSSVDHVLDIAGFVSSYGGKTVRVTVSADGTNAFVYADGTQIGTYAVSPNLTGLNVGIGKNISSAFYTGTLGPVSIVNAALSSAEIATLAETGRLPSWCNSAQVGQPAGVGLITGDNSTFASDTAFWAKGTGATISAGAAHLSGSGSYLSKGGLQVVGMKYRAAVNITALTGSVYFGNLSGAELTTQTTTGTKTIEYTCTAAGNFGLQMTGAGTCDFDDITLTPLGSVLNLDPDMPGSGNSWRNTNGTGDAVKGATGIQWALPATQLERADVLTRTQSSARRQMIQLSGSSLQKSTLGFDVGTSPFSLHAVLTIPSSNPASTNGVICLSSDPSVGLIARGVDVIIDASRNLLVSLRGAAITDYNRATVSLLPYSGQTVTLEIVRPASGDAVIKINGETVVATQSTGGTAPTWQGTVNSTYYHLGARGTEYYTGSLTASLLLGNLTAAESARWHATGEWPAWAQAQASGGAGTTLNSTAFANRTYDTFSGASATGFTAVSSGGTKGAASGSFFSVSVGNKIRIPYTLTLNSGQAPYVDIENPGVVAYSAATQLTAGSGVVELTATAAANGTAKIGVFNTAASDYSIVFGTIQPLGLAAHYDERWDGRGGIWPDVSGAYRHLTLATSGVTAAVTSEGNAGTYGNIYVVDGVTAQSIPNGASYTKLTPFTNNGASSDCIVSAANDQITLTRAGKYMVDIAWSGAVGTANAMVDFAAFLDSTELNQVHASRKFASLDIGALSCSGIITATANQVLTLQAKHDNGAAVNVTTHDCSMNVFWLGI